MAIHNGEMKVFIGSANPELGESICKELGIKPAKSEVIRFNEGNTMVRLLENVRGRDCFIIQGISYPVNDNFVELLFWINALKLASAAQVTAIIPFFSYAKGDKKDEPRVSIRARVCADAIEAAGADRIVTMDLHSPQIEGFFKIPVDHLYARPVIADYFKSKKLSNLVVASADVGFGKTAYKFADHLKTSTVIGNKIRKDHSEKAKVWSVVGDVKDKDVLIVDDIVFSGGTLVSMANAVKALGAKSIFAAVTHGVFSKGASQKIGNSPIIEMVTTDTVEHHFGEPLKNLVKLSTAVIVAKAIESIHEYQSVSALENNE